MHLPLSIRLLNAHCPKPNMIRGREFNWFSLHNLFNCVIFNIIRQSYYEYSKRIPKIPLTMFVCIIRNTMSTLVLCVVWAREFVFKGLRCFVSMFPFPIFVSSTPNSTLAPPNHPSTNTLHTNSFKASQPALKQQKRLHHWLLFRSLSNMHGIWAHEPMYTDLA